MEPTRPARVGFRGDSGFGLRRTSKWPLGLLHLLGRVRATARYEVTWKERMERMVRTDVVGSYLQLLDSWLAHQVRSGGGGERDVWARLGTSGPGRPGLTLCLSSENTIRDHFRNGSSDFTIVESKTEGWHGSGQ